MFDIKGFPKGVFDIVMNYAFVSPFIVKFNRDNTIFRFRKFSITTHIIKRDLDMLIRAFKLKTESQILYI